MSEENNRVLTGIYHSNLPKDGAGGRAGKGGLDKEERFVLSLTLDSFRSLVVVRRPIPAESVCLKGSEVALCSHAGREEREKDSRNSWHSSRPSRESSWRKSSTNRPVRKVCLRVCVCVQESHCCVSFINGLVVLTDMESDEDKVDDAAPTLSDERLYDCVICNQTTPTTRERPLMLVSLLQSSSGIHSFVRSFIHSFVRSFVRSFVNFLVLMNFASTSIVCTVFVPLHQEVSPFQCWVTGSTRARRRCFRSGSSRRALTSRRAPPRWRSASACSSNTSMRCVSARPLFQGLKTITENSAL